MKLLIDNRESIKELFIDSEINIVFDNLLLGDYIFKHNDQDIIIIERKTVEDYANSIRDGRHREQKSRLLSNYSKKTGLIMSCPFDTRKNLLAQDFYNFQYLTFPYYLRKFPKIFFVIKYLRMSLSICQKRVHPFQ